MESKIILLFGLLAIVGILLTGCSEALITDNVSDSNVTNNESLESPPEPEPKMCTREYNPQCGTDGVTYSNPCMAEGHEIAYEGQCKAEEDLVICTMDYTPVCGVDGVTYGNACTAGKTEIAYDGECKTEETTAHVCTPEEKEAMICTMDYRPVCGNFDNTVQCITAPCVQTFSNGCSACASGNVDSYVEGEC